MTVLPYKESKAGKKEQVASMFDNISKKYDFLNHFLSLGIDIRWRKKAIRMLKSHQPEYILDVATGTGDFALQALSLKPKKIIGIDISKGMLEVGIEKMKKKKVDDIIELQVADSENLPFQENKFDAVIVSFGVRNFENLKIGLAEMLRVVRKGGKVVIIEFSQPTRFPFKQVYNFYFKNILPRVGKIFSKDNSAYTYLPESVGEFPHGKEFLSILEEIGYKNAQCKPLTFGISSIYMAEK